MGDDCGLSLSRRSVGVARSCCAILSPYNLKLNDGLKLLMLPSPDAVLLAKFGLTLILGPRFREAFCAKAPPMAFIPAPSMAPPTLTGTAPYFGGSPGMSGTESSSNGWLSMYDWYRFLIPVL